MKAITTLFATLAVLVAAIPALAQQPPRLPLVRGYPIAETSLDPIFPPAIWSDHVDSFVTYHGSCPHPGNLNVYQESLGTNILHFPIPGCPSVGGWYFPDIFDHFIAYTQIPFVTPQMEEIVSLDLGLGLFHHLSHPGDYNRHVSITESWAAWEHRIAPGFPREIHFNAWNGNPGGVQAVTGYPVGSEPRWPSIWKEVIAFELAGPLSDTIGIYDIHKHGFTSLPSLPNPALGRYAPHVADGRIAYHVRDDPGLAATVSEIRYVDYPALGAETTPAFLAQVPCNMTAAPRVGGPGPSGRLILFTGVDCGPHGASNLYLGDTWTNKVYLVNSVGVPDTSVERPFYDIFGDTIVYQRSRGGSFEFIIARIDVSAL